MTRRGVLTGLTLAIAAGCARPAPAVGPRPGAKPAAKVEFDSASGDIYYVPATIPAGYARLEATWRGRDLFVIAHPVQGPRKVFWKLIPPYVNFQLRNQIATQYFGSGKRTISILVFDDGSEIAHVAVAGSRRNDPRADSPLGAFFREQVKDAMSEGGREKELPADVPTHDAAPPVDAALPTPASSPEPGPDATPTDVAPPSATPAPTP